MNKFVTLDLRTQKKTVIISFTLTDENGHNQTTQIIPESLPNE